MQYESIFLVEMLPPSGILCTHGDKRIRGSSIVWEVGVSTPPDDKRGGVVT